MSPPLRPDDDNDDDDDDGGGGGGDDDGDNDSTYDGGETGSLLMLCSCFLPSPSASVFINPGP